MIELSVVDSQAEGSGVDLLRHGIVFDRSGTENDLTLILKLVGLERDAPLHESQQRVVFRRRVLVCPFNTVCAQGRRKSFEGEAVGNDDYNFLTTLCARGADAARRSGCCAGSAPSSGPGDAASCACTRRERYSTAC